MGVFEKIAKRSVFPVEVNGGTVYICEPTFKEIRRVREMEGERRDGLTLAFCIVNPDGSKACSPVSGESDEQLADRMLSEMDELTPGAVVAISDAIGKLSRPVNTEKLAKN